MFTYYNGKVHYIMERASDYIKTLSTKGEVYIPMSEVNLIYDITFYASYSSELEGIKGLWEIPLEYGNVKRDYVVLISEFKTTHFKKGADGRYRKRVPLDKARIIAKIKYHIYGSGAIEREIEEPISPEYLPKIFSDHLNATAGRIVGVYTA